MESLTGQSSTCSAMLLLRSCYKALESKQAQSKGRGCSVETLPMPTLLLAGWLKHFKKRPTDKVWGLIQTIRGRLLCLDTQDIPCYYAIP
eukprot:222929-Pelagomonas_calceolata.AAC.3